MAKQELLLVEHDYLDIRYGNAQRDIQKYLDEGYRLVGPPMSMDKAGRLIFTLIRETETEAD